jgi:tRNA A-37 threonylcarbamoyl transferase component Bud32
MLEPGQLIDGKYVIERLLGEGGMGAVFVASHTVLSKKVAIKVLHQEFADKAEMAERFVREAKAASLIGHENIIDVTDIGRTDGGTLYIVMELLEGESLESRLRRAQRLPAAKAAEICGQVLLALRHAHAKGIIHRDIKPENVFLTTIAGRRDFVKILDFGISKYGAAFASTPEAMHLTKSGAVMGTPYYMAPEQARGEVVDHRIDIYSTGVILYEAVTGALPYDGPNAQAVIFKIAKGEMVHPRAILPEIPSDLEAVILKAMASDPEQRFYSAAEFFTRLKPFGAKDYAAPEGQAAGAREAGSEEGAGKTSLAPSGPVPGGSAGGDAVREAGTLAGTAPHIAPETKGKNRRLIPILAGAAAIALILASAGFFLVTKIIGKTRGGDESTSIPIDLHAGGTGAGPAEGLKTGPFSLRVAARPGAARIKMDGRLVDGNPAEIEIAGGEDHVIRAEAEGFDPQERHVSLSADREIGFDLVPTKTSSSKSAKTKAVTAAQPRPPPAGGASQATAGPKPQEQKKAIKDTWDDVKGKGDSKGKTKKKIITDTWDDIAGKEGAASGSRPGQ